MSYAVSNTLSTLFEYIATITYFGIELEVAEALTYFVL